MSEVFFNPSHANDLAKFQGTFAGIQAGNANICGTAMAPTSVFNQAGYYALQNTDTGYVHLQKLGDDSIYTNEWYDQGTGTQFSFKPQAKTFDASQLSGHMTAAQIAALDN